VSASPIQLAQAVAGVITAAALSFDGQAVAAAASLVIQWDPKLLTNLRVGVTPASYAQALLSRSGDEETLVIDVGIARRCIPTDDAGVLALDALVRSIADTLNRKPVTFGTRRAAWKGVEREPIYDVDLLHQARTFLSVLSLTYVVLP
jgi:hypothetical protein